MIGEILGHNNRLRSSWFATPTVYMLTSSGFPLLNWGIVVDSSTMIGNFPAVLNFDRLFLKPNWFICN